MAVKTITVTEKAYEALKAKKAPNESFSETILRFAGSRSLKEFAGALSDESAKRLKESIKEIRHRHTWAHKKRVQRIVEALEGN
ncbi:MAG: antitoxin VapB family protein [Nanoarchaeota archaeon]